MSYQVVEPLHKKGVTAEQLCRVLSVSCSRKCLLYQLLLSGGCYTIWR